MRSLLILSLLSLIACAERTSVLTDEIVRNHKCREISEAEAVRSALDYLHVSADQIPFRSSSKLKNGDWVVLLSENPDVPGSEVILVVDRCGDVVRSEHGR